MSVLILVSNGDIQRSFKICSQDQHAQAQRWLRHAQAQLMHAHLFSLAMQNQGRTLLACICLQYLSFASPPQVTSTRYHSSVQETQVSKVSKSANHRGEVSLVLALELDEYPKPFHINMLDFYGVSFVHVCSMLIGSEAI